MPNMSKVKTKKSRSMSESETSDESDSSSASESEEERLKKSKHKKRNKHKKDKKQNRRKSKSDKDSAENSSGESSGSEKERRRPSVRSKKERSRSRDREKQQEPSKWESPRRRRDRSRSRDRNRERSRSHQRDRSHDRYRGGRDRLSREQKDRGNVKRDDHYRRDAGDRNYNRRGRSPQRERERSRDRNYIKREPRSPRRERDSDNRYKNRRRDDDNDKNYEWGKSTEDKKPAVKEEPKEKEKPNFALSGALTEDTNKVNGVVIKYSEPLEARKPKRRWRLYPFKGETALPVLHIHRQSCFLVGRDRKVVDLAVDHPSCSKQHAALQYRLVPFEREDGTMGKRVRLYLIDLDSANGTFLNNKRIDSRKYYELIEKDVIKFGFSTREYVLLHENSKEDQEDDDIEVKEEPIEN
ncbi:uncharacterized protein LOC142231850 [Haematobia irritans]|uniref:uncharacterized protein LOC142231850 n=1 Tax=Haematobia irritans TaxID=7368 RepID=UPI003F5067BB